MPRISVCQLFGYYDYSGITQVVMNLSLRLRKKFDVTLVCRRIKREIDEDIEIIELKPKNTLELWKTLSRLIDQCDITHTHDVYSLPGLLRKKETKVVYTDHGIVPLKYSSPMSFHGTFFAHFSRFFACKTDVCIGISDYIVSELKHKVGCSNVIKIPNGVDIEMFRPITDPEKYLRLKLGNPMLLKVGMIEKHKAIDYHIVAMPFILKKFPNARLVFIGAGKYIDYYRAKVRAMGLDRYIHFLGWVHKEMLPLYYNAADIALQVDYWHGFGLPILEAMACGKPVIARDAYAMREHIRKSGAGVLVRGKDPRELAIAVEKILEDYDTYASRARKYAERFDWNVIVARYEEVYRKILS